MREVEYIRISVVKECLTTAFNNYTQNSTPTIVSFQKQKELHHE